RIQSIRYGPYRVWTAYDAPYPEAVKTPVLQICTACCLFFTARTALVAHRRQCAAHRDGRLPGVRVFEDNEVALECVSGEQTLGLCTCLSLMTRLFLESKELCYSVRDFDFYILLRKPRCRCGAAAVAAPHALCADPHCAIDRSLGCIFVLPPFQGRGYAQLLIEYSYKRMQALGRHGRPEEPLSAAGAAAFHAY
ncbi:hypothetical protein CXG81DRAFT_8234, partial [Caulochytrium protostelioides]